MDSKRITFERITDSNIIGYSIFAIDGGKLKKIASVDNPKKESPIKIHHSFVPSDIISMTGMSTAYRLKHSAIVTSMQDGVLVTINGDRVNGSNIAINKKERSLTIYDRLSHQDVVKVDYHIDGLEYMYTDGLYDQFIVKAVFNESNITVGKHYKLV